MKRLQVYLRELAFACHEASVSDDPRVVALCLALLIRAPWSLWDRTRAGAGNVTLCYPERAEVIEGIGSANGNRTR